MSYTTITEFEVAAEAYGTEAATIIGQIVAAHRVGSTTLYGMFDAIKTIDQSVKVEGKPWESLYWAAWMTLIEPYTWYHSY